MFNELGEGGIWSHGGSFNEMFYESREGKLDGFSCLESLKHVLKKTLGCSLFIINLLGLKRGDYYT